MDIWCAARGMCTNKTCRTINNSRCIYCNYQVHDECFCSQYCLWCYKLKELEDQDRKFQEAKQLGQIHQESYHDNDMENNNTKMADTEYEDKSLLDAFPANTSAILYEDSICNQSNAMETSLNSSLNETEQEILTLNDNDTQQQQQNEIEIVARTMSMLTSVTDFQLAPDPVLQSLANSLGIAIKKRH
jgi:hypothetical protein